MLAVLHHNEIPCNHGRVEKYQPYAHQLNKEGMTYQVNQTNKKMLLNFEENTKILVNILGLTEEKEVVPYRTARIDHQYPELDDELDDYTLVVLLIIFDDEGKSHYVWVKNFSALLQKLKGCHANRAVHYCPN